ncbi:MAG: KilA-N domain-containing protein [Nanoarchaeota archaeon]|nr:KilA-N domain-containing protein [Nanoarchaeota archaeon]
MSNKLIVLNKEINLISKNEKNYICLTDIAGFKDTQKSNDVIRNWIRNRNTLEFLGIWEEIYNGNFNAVEFDGFKKISGLNSFTLTPKQWVEKTNAIGIISKPGRYGGTYAHKDIAFEFASWISPKFKLYLIKEFERLKEYEIKSQKLDWNFKRNLVKLNYKIHTNAIKENLIPKKISEEQKNIIYANEADILNVALFGFTAKMWKEENIEKEGNLRDYATASQLVCLSNLESLNSVLIEERLSQKERLIKLNKIAISQMRILLETPELKDKIVGENK